MTGTGFTANHTTVPHPDPSRTGTWEFYFDTSLGDVGDIILTGDGNFNGESVLSNTIRNGAQAGVGPEADPGVNEIQTLANPLATAGTFTLSFTINGITYTTAALNYNADYQAVENAINAISSLSATIKVTDTDRLYTLESITNGTNNLAFTIQSTEILLDGVAQPNLIGVSLGNRQCY